MSDLLDRSARGPGSAAHHDLPAAAWLHPLRGVPEAQPTVGRRQWLAFATSGWLLGAVAPASAATSGPPWDPVIVVDGWVVRASDLRPMPPAGR